MFSLHASSERGERQGTQDTAILHSWPTEAETPCAGTGTGPAATAVGKGTDAIGSEANARSEIVVVIRRAIGSHQAAAG